MAAGVHFQEPVLDTLRREDEIEKLMDQATNITLVKIVVEGNIGASHIPIEPPDTLETDFEVKDSVKGKEGSVSTSEDEKFLKSPSAAVVYFDENNLAPDACQVTENAEKMVTEHETDASQVGESKLDAEESDGLEKSLVSALEVAATREADHDESIPVHEAGLPENKEDRESTILETVDDTETTSSVEEKSMTSTSQEILHEKFEQTTFNTNQETPENTSNIVPNEETEQNLSIHVDDSQMKTDENLEKEDEKPESTLVPEGNKYEESMQNELFETKTETETVNQERKEAIEKEGVESSPVASSDAEDIKASTSDHDTKTSALENQIPAENPLETEVYKSECKPKKETPEEQVEDVSTLSSVIGEDDSVTKDEARLEKESAKPCFTDDSTRDASHDETTPVDKAKTENKEPSKSDLFEDKEDTESTILVEEPIMEKHLESLSAAHDDIKACDLVQDTEAKSSIKEKLQTSTPQEIRGDKLEQTALDTNEETPEDISTNISNEETEKNSILEVPFVAEALKTDNELATAKGKIKDEDQREKDSLENNNGTASELLKQEVTEEPVESLQLANEAEVTKVSTSDHDTKISVLETDNELAIAEGKLKDEDQREKDSHENKNDTENELLKREVTEKPVESLQIANEAEDTKVSSSDHDTEISALENQILSENSQQIVADETESKPCDVVDTKKETPDILDVSTIESNDDNAENPVVEEDEGEKPLLREEPTRDVAGDESTYTNKDKNKGEDPRRAELFENANSVESISLAEDNTKLKHVESPQVDAEDIKTHVLDQDAETTDRTLASEGKANDGESAVKFEIKTEDDYQKEDQMCDYEKNPESNVLVEAAQLEMPMESLQETLPSAVPQGLLDEKSEEKTVDAILDLQHDVSTIVLHDDHEETSVIGEGDSQMKNEENVRDEIKPSTTEASRTDASGDEPANKREDKNEGKEQMRVESFEEETTPQPLRSPQVGVEDIKTYVSGEGTETTGLVEVFEGVANDDEPDVERNEDEGQKKVELCDTENIPGSTLLLEAVHMEKPFESSKEALLTLVPQGSPDENIEGNDTTTVPKENIEDESKEEREITSIIEALTKNNDDNSVNVHEDSSEHEDLRKHEFGDAKSTSQKEEAQVETPAKSLNIASKDIIASNSSQETEAMSSQEERTLKAEETVCEQIEVETLDTADTKMQTSEAQDVSTMVPNDGGGENSVTKKNDLQMKYEELSRKEKEKPSVIEASTADASGDDSASKCNDKVEGEEQTVARLFEGEKDMESKLLKEEEIMVRLVESPQVDTEDIKTYVSDEGAGTTGILEASQRDANNDEFAVKDEVKTEDDDKKEDEPSVKEKNTESGELLEAAQTEKPTESLQQTLPSTIPQGFLNDNTGEKTVDAFQKDENVQNVTTTVSNEKIEENLLIEMDGSQIQHEEYLEKAHEIPYVIKDLTKHVNDDELIVHEDNIEHEDPKKVEFGSEKDTEINSQEHDARIETHIKSSQVIAEDIITSDSYQGAETTDCQEERSLNENEIVHEEEEVERLDADDTKKETPEALDVSTFVTNDDNKENLLIGEDDSEIKNEKNLGKEGENPSSVEASPMDATGDESTKKFEDKIEGEHMTAEDTVCTLLKEAESSVQPLESPQVDVENIKTYVSDQGTGTTDLVEVFEEAANDNQPEVECTIKNEDKDVVREDELCDNEKIRDSSLPLEVAEMDKPFESLKEALPASVTRGFLDEKTEAKITDATEKDEGTHEIQVTEEKIVDATEKDEGTCEIQNTTTIVSNENAEDDSLLQLDGSQIQSRECLEEASERTPLIEASTKITNDDDSINVHEYSTEHEDLRKYELVEIEEDKKITSQKEGAQVETSVELLQIPAEDIIESDSCQKIETKSSHEELILNEEETVRQQIEVETIHTADTKKKTPEPQDVSTIVPNDDIEAKSATGENYIQMENEENLGKESRKPSVIEASMMDDSGDELTNKREDKVEGEEQMGAGMFVDKKDKSTLLKEEEITQKLVESPHVDTENIKIYVSEEGVETTGLVEAFQGDADDDKSAVKYEVKTENNDQKEDKLCDNENNPESAVLLEATQIEKPIESLKETLPSTVPREFLDDKAEEKTMDAIEKDKEIIDIQNVAKTVSNEKIEDDSLIQTDGSQIQHEEYLEKEIEIPAVIEASTKHASDDKLISINEDIIEHKDLRKVELVESKKDEEINLQKDEMHVETSVKSLQVAAEDIIASDSYHGTETTSQEELLLNENEIIYEQIAVETLDTADSDKETPEAPNFAIVVYSENTKESSQIPEDGSEQKHEELLEQESKAPHFSETFTTEANDEVPLVIHQDKIENDNLEKVGRFECDKHQEVILLKEEPAEKLNGLSKEDLEDIKDVAGANSMERSLIEVQSPNENQQQIFGHHLDDNIVDKDPEEIKDAHLDKDAVFENEKHTEICFIKEEPVKELQEPGKKDLQEIKALVSHEVTETTSFIEEQDFTDISQESVGDTSEDKILAKAEDIQDFTPIVTDEHAEKNPSIQPDGSQVKHEELSEKECEMLSTPKHSFLYSSSNEPMTSDVDNIENEHSNKVDKFEDEKHTDFAMVNDQAQVEELQESLRRDLEEVKACVSWEGAETSSIEEQGLTEISPEIMGDELEEKLLDKVGTSPEFANFVSDENGKDIPLMLVDESQIKHEKPFEKESEASPLSETSSQNSNFNQDKIEDELLNRDDKFDPETHAEISLKKDEAPLEKLNESSLEKDLEEIKAFDLSEDTKTSSTGERNLTAIAQENDSTTVDASQIKHELLERESETPPLPLLQSSDRKSTVVHTGKIEDGLLEKTDKSECMQSGEATLLNEEASAEKLPESTKDLVGIEESIAGDGTEITSSTEEQTLITISQETVDDQVVEKVLDVAGDASDSTTIIPNNNTERNLLVEDDASQMKHEEHLEKESEIPSLLMLNTCIEEPTIVHKDKITEHAETILSNEEALQSSSKEENKNMKPSVLCEDTETSSIEQESLISNSHEIVGDQVKEKIIDMDQNALDLTTDENAEENSSIHLDGFLIKHEEPLDKESETPSMSMLDTTTEESTILQGRIIHDQDPGEVDKFERETDTGATLLKEPTPVENVTVSMKDDLEDTKVFLSCDDKEITSSIEEQSKKANQQELMIDQTQENILDSADEAQDFKQTVSHENAGDNLLIQVENVLDTAPKDDDFKQAISHENTEENSLIQVDELQRKHDELGKESETSSLLMVDTSNESKTIYEDITEDESVKKINDFECEKQEERTSTEEETRVTKVNESSKEVLEDIKALISGEDSETTSFEEKQSIKESPRQIFIDQQEEKILDAAPEAQNFVKVVSNENVEKDSMIQEDESQMVHEEISEKEGETPSLSAAFILNTTSEDSIVIHENKIENEIFECEKPTVDGKLLDTAPKSPESKIIVLDENTEEKLSNQVDKSQTKHEEFLEDESKKLRLSGTSLLNTSNEDSTTINDDKVEDEDPEKVKLECEEHELPLTKEEEPVQKLNNPLKEDIEEIKAFGSCLDTETTSSMEDQSLQINPQVVNGDQLEENIIDTTPKPQNFTALASDENTKENLSLDLEESRSKHEALLEIESEKPSLSILKTSNEDSQFIRDSKTENEDVKRDEKVEQLNDFPEGPRNTKVSVPSKNLETSPIEERSLTENPQENLTKDKVLDVVPEAQELKTTESDKNIEENSIILEDGSQMKHEEHSENESEKPSLTDALILNSRNEEPTIFLEEKIEDGDQAKVNKSECEKHAEITEVPVENTNSSNLEDIEAFVSCEDIKPTNSTDERCLTVNPVENLGVRKVESVLDNPLGAPDCTPIVPDDNDDCNPSIQVDGSQVKHEPLEKESKMPSSLETSLLNTKNKELETIENDNSAEEALNNVDEFESRKCSEVNKFKEEGQVEESRAYKDIKAYVSHEDTEASVLQAQILTANPQDISEDNFIDTADSKEKITENLPVSNVNVVKDSLIQIDESETKDEEILGKEPYLVKTSTLEANKESTSIHDMIEEESGKLIESTLLREESPAYESVDSLQVVCEDIKASVSCQKMDTSCSNLNADPQETAGDQTEDKVNTAGTREITLEALNLTTLVSNENEVLDSSTSQDGLEIEHKEISILADSKESIIIHDDTVEGGNLKKVDTLKTGQQTENTLSKEEAHEDESMDSLQLASEPIKASVSCQDRDPTSAFEEQILTTTPQISSDLVEEKVTDTAKTWEEKPEVSSSILVFQEDVANRIEADDINSVMVKDEETLKRDTASDEICSLDKVQAKEEENEIVSKAKINETADNDTWIKLPEDKTYIEVKELDFSSNAEDTSEITQHDGAKEIPKVHADVEQIDKDIKTEAVLTETGAASSALPIIGVQCGTGENESEENETKETEMSLEPEGREYQGPHTKLHESPSPTLSHVKDSEWEMAQKRGTENLQSGDDKNDDMKELDEGSVKISNENVPEANSYENTDAEVTAGEKEASAIQQDPVSEFGVQEIQEQPGKTVEAVPEEKEIKSEQGEIKYDDSNDLKINSSTSGTDKVAPSDILCSSTSDAGQKAGGQETQIVVQEKEQNPGKGKAVEAVPQEKGINTEKDEIKEHDFDVFKENSCIVALDKVTPINALQSSTTDAVLKVTDEETPEQHGLDEANLKEIEGNPASAIDALAVLKADQIDNANIDSSVGSNKILVLQHRDSSESSQTEGEKQKTLESERGENCENLDTAKPMKTSESTDMDMPSLSGLLQEPVKEVSIVIDQLVDKSEPTTHEEELQSEKSAKVEHVKAKTDEEKGGKGESGEHQISELSSDTPIIVDAADRNVKVVQKKSQNILSGVGSKVKHSISKVKKAITGKSSHAKSASPKYSEKI